jgi:hypothetical protein
VYMLPKPLLAKTFELIRQCGRGRRECQVLWTSAWQSPAFISDVVHPAHSAHVGGFTLESRWISSFWLELAAQSKGVRVQVHTHPSAAFHSSTDDQYPIINTPGFLSLVIPGFGLGAIGFKGAFLAEISPNGDFKQVPISSRLKLLP